MTRKRDPVRSREVAEVAAVAEAIAPRFKALVLISAWCGLRWGEVTELRRKDIGEGAALISVSRGVAHRQGCHVDTPKSGKPRNVVVPPHISADIKAHLDEDEPPTRRRCCSRPSTVAVTCPTRPSGVT